MLSKNFEQRIKFSKSIGDGNKSDKDKFYFEMGQRFMSASTTEPVFI